MLASHFSTTNSINDIISLISVTVDVDAVLLPVVERTLEASLVHMVVKELCESCKDITCFIPTPHRSQRSFINQRLIDLKDKCKELKADTVDKMQGQEADCVIFSALLTNPDTIVNESEFLFNLQRMNVGMSRAQKLSILLVSSQLCSPLPEILRSAEARKGYERLLAFIDTCKTHIKISVSTKSDTFSANISIFRDNNQLTEITDVPLVGAPVLQAPIIVAQPVMGAPVMPFLGAPMQAPFMGAHVPHAPVLPAPAPPIGFHPIANRDIRLKVPYAEKDDAKGLGARWNPTSKFWYIPQGKPIYPGFDRWRI